MHTKKGGLYVILILQCFLKRFWTIYFSHRKGEQPNINIAITLLADQCLNDKAINLDSQAEIEILL